MPCQKFNFADRENHPANQILVNSAKGYSWLIMRFIWALYFIK